MHVRFLFYDDGTDQPVLSFLATTRGGRPTKEKAHRVVDVAKTKGSARAVVQSAFQKTLFALSRCRIAEDDGSGDLLSRSQLHANDRGEVGSAERKQNLDAFVGYSSHAAAVAFIGRTA